MSKSNGFSRKKWSFNFKFRNVYDVTLSCHWIIHKSIEYTCWSRAYLVLFKLFGIPIILLWAYMVTVIPDWTTWCALNSISTFLVLEKESMNNFTEQTGEATSHGMVGIWNLETFTFKVDKEIRIQVCDVRALERINNLNHSSTHSLHLMANNSNPHHVNVQTTCICALYW